MVLRKDIESLMERTRTFYKEKEGRGALIQVKDIASIVRPNIKALNQWRFPEDLYEYLDANIERLKSYWGRRQGIEDDLIPSIYPWFGIAEHSAYVGGDVDFSADTSWHYPIIQTWDDLDDLQLVENNTWFSMVIDGLRYLKEKSDGEYAVKLRGGYSPLDLANALRGNDIFVDFYEDPDQVHRLLEFCSRAVKWSMDNQKEAVGDFYSGVITGMDVWLPGNSIGHFSEDTSTMCSPAIYREFGKSYTMELLKDYDLAFMHTHGLGIQNIPEIASIPEIDVIEISNDPNCPRAIEIYKELAGELEGKVVVVDITLDEIKGNLDFLRENRTIIWYSAEDVEDAKEAVALVRKELTAYYL